MALTRDQKEVQVQELIEKMGSASSVIFTHYIGLSVAEVAELRAKLRESDAEMKVAKKTLMKIAAKDAGLPELGDDVLDGPVSLIFSSGDPLAGAQIAFKFAKTHEQVELIGGVFEGAVLTKEQAITLAKMPNRETLLGTFVGMIRSPLNSFAGMCNSPLSGFARALSEMADKGGFGEEAPAEGNEQAAPAAEESKKDEEESKDNEENKDEVDKDEDSKEKGAAAEKAATETETPSAEGAEPDDDEKSDS